jgi:hypothetical protein
MSAVAEREWVFKRTGESYSVDLGLEDAWLEALNGFDHLHLRSICEGHPDGSTWASRKCMPILRLSIAPATVIAVKASDSAVDAAVSSQFAASPLSETSTMEHGWSSFDADEYFIHLDSRRHRASAEMEPWVQEWFSDAIAFLRSVDAFIRDSVGHLPPKKT